MRAISPASPKENAMNGTRIIAVVLLIAGTLGLLYGGFSYTQDSTAVKLGPLELSVKEKKAVNVPLWASVGALVVGGILLVVGGRKG
jgi:TRAP-type C4-dicarboxylate transport system permease small subunit